MSKDKPRMCNRCWKKKEACFVLKLKFWFLFLRSPWAAEYFLPSAQSHTCPLLLEGICEDLPASRVQRLLQVRASYCISAVIFRKGSVFTFITWWCFVIFSLHLSLFFTRENKMLLHLCILEGRVRSGGLASWTSPTGTVMYTILPSGRPSTRSESSRRTLLGPR